MALNNLRIIYQNLADTATTITASSAAAGTPVTNLLKDAKGSVWRSTSTSAGLKVDLGTSQTIGGVILPFTNIPGASATITVRGFDTDPTLTSTTATVVAPATTLFTQTTVCCPWNTLGLSTGAPNTYAYGGGTCARVWLTAANQLIPARYITIHFSAINTGAAVAATYIEASRLIIGRYWSPTYNTGYGMTATVRDLSTHERTESGDLVTQRGPRFNSLSFDLSWLSPTDRIQMTKLLLGNGISKPIFVSLFPDNGSTATAYEMERAHQIYGKLMQTPGISYHTLDMYSSQLELEEV